MSYSKLAKLCAIGSAIVSAIFSAIIVALSPLGLGYLPIALVVAIVVGLLTYLLIWMAWAMNSRELSKKGYRW
jgi:hypothetical protein